MVSPFAYNAPRPRTSRVNLEPVGACIYCDRSPPVVDLTDEHILADGLGGDLVLPMASCRDCAAITGRSEQHLLREVVQLQRAVAGVSSRKRRTTARTLKFRHKDAPEGETQELVIDSSMPLIYPFFVTNALPGILRGGDPNEEPTMRLEVFGPPDWNQRLLAWAGKEGSFRLGHRLHAGVVGQALAKTAHAFATAQLGYGSFEPFLTDYIRAQEPNFPGYLIGSYPTNQEIDALHFVDIQTTTALRAVAVGLVVQTVYVVALRLFAYQPSPAFLIVAGRPLGPVPKRMLSMNKGW